MDNEHKILEPRERIRYKRIILENNLFAKDVADHLQINRSQFRQMLNGHCYVIPKAIEYLEQLEELSNAS